MQVLVNIKGAEQSWNFDTGQQQNYLVVEFAGIEIQVPCCAGEPTDEVRGLAKLAAETTPVEIPEVDETEVRDAPSTFVQHVAKEVESRAGLQQIGGAPESVTLEPKARKLAPLKRERGDDVGIAQG